MDKTQWEFLEIWLDQAREECLRNLQMTAPLVACCISPNGSTCTVRYSTHSNKPEILSERAAASGFDGPMTIILVTEQRERRLHNGAFGHDDRAN
jgi:hypothetical protein